MLSDYYKVVNQVDDEDIFLNKYDSSSHRNEFDYLIVDYKNTLAGALGGAIVGTGVGAKTGLKKGLGLGIKIGFIGGMTAGMAAGVVGTKICLMSKDMLKEKIPLHLEK